MNHFVKHYSIVFSTSSQNEVALKRAIRPRIGQSLLTSTLEINLYTTLHKLMSLKSLKELGSIHIVGTKYFISLF